MKTEESPKPPLKLKSFPWTGFPAGCTFRREDIYDYREFENSAELYAEIYAKDKELQALTDSAIEDWPE